MFHSKVYITLKKSILDPQGNAVEEGIHSLGYNTISNVRIGKYIEMDIDADTKEKAEQLTKEISEKLLANLIMESFSFSVEPIKERESN